MRDAARGVWVVLVGLAGLVQLGGCPTDGVPDIIAPDSSKSALIGAEAKVTVLTPVGDLSIAGGTQVEVNWTAVARTRITVINVLIDQDQIPDNGNEIVAFGNLPLGETRVLVDTTSLKQGTYSLGVVLEELGEIVASGYAPGTITIDQRPTLYFVDTPESLAQADLYSARENVTFDRSRRIVGSFHVAWELNDPDSPQSTIEVLLDPDELANANEVLLYRTSIADQAASADDRYQFKFDLPTAEFEPGTYRLLAVVSDGRNAVPFYAPGAIRLRSRLAGPVDLRDMHLPSGGVSGAVIEGFNPYDNAGSFVSSAADMDADGFDEILIMAQFAKPAYYTNFQRTGIGEAYLIYGRQQRFSGVLNLNSTGVLFRGNVYTGVREVPDPVRPSRGITSFDVLSDWDRDGVREMAFGMPFTDSVAVNFFDNRGAFRTGGVVIAAGGSLRPSLGFPGGEVVPLAQFGMLRRGTAVIPPPCAESHYGPNSAAGAGGVTSMWRHVAGGPLDLENNQPGCRIHTHEFGDQCGEVVSAYSFSGLLISVPNRDPVYNTSVGYSVPGAGVVSVFHGSYLMNGQGSYPWNLDDPGDDLPHNGPYRYILDDNRLFPTARGNLPASPGYWVDAEPSADAPPCTTDWDNTAFSPTVTVRVYGGFEGAGISGGVQVGDFNADGINDFLVGSPLSNEGAGACFIVLGRLPDLVAGNDLPVEELGLPMRSDDAGHQRIFDGIRVIGVPGDRLGQSQASAGDFNNDGIGDVVIGSPLINDRKGGVAVFFGSRDVINLTQADIPFDELPARGLGVVFEGEEDGDLAGARVANAGDVDGDGNTDILIAAPNRSVRMDVNEDGYPEIDRTDCGVVYLVYGSPHLQGTLSLADVGTTKLPGAVFIGRQSDDFLGAGLGEQGDRSFGIASAGDVDGDGRGDLLLGSVSAGPRDRARAGEVYLLYGAGD